MNRVKGIWYKFKELLPWILVACTAISSNLAASALQDTFAIWKTGTLGSLDLLRLSYVVFFVVSVCALYKVKSAFFQPRTRFMRSESPEKRKHLILFLSDLDTKKGVFTGGVPAHVSITDNLDNDIKNIEAGKENFPPWKWEMPLRAIRHHIGRLESVTMVCSRESIQQIDWFHSLLRQYPALKGNPVQLLAKKDNRPVVLVGLPYKAAEMDGIEGLNFEEFDELTSALLHLIRTFTDKKIPEREIMIDFTGGQKVTSVVAAAVTFNRKIKAQYVQTSGPWGVKSYDLIMGSSETEGLG